MIVGKICSRVTVSASPNETVRAAAERMAVTDVGTLVVLDGTDGGKPVGIVTDRDLVIRCLGVHLDPDQTQVGAVMSRPVHSVDAQTSVEEALHQMAKAGTRRLVVTGNESRTVGLLSLDDVLDVLADEAAAVRGVLAKQRCQIPEGFCVR